MDTGINKDRDIAKNCKEATTRESRIVHNRKIEAAKGVNVAQQFENKRKEYAKEIVFVRETMFFATAAAFAAGAADMVSNTVAGGLGNFGILLILARVYFMVPVIIASVRAQDYEWARYENARVMQLMPWIHRVGRVGWGLLFVSVVMQLVLGVD